MDRRSYDKIWVTRAAVVPKHVSGSPYSGLWSARTFYQRIMAWENKSRRGIGASSLSPDEIATWEQEHWAYMQTLHEEFDILHYVTILDLEKKSWYHSHGWWSWQKKRPLVCRYLSIHLGWHSPVRMLLFQRISRKGRTKNDLRRIFWIFRKGLWWCKKINQIPVSIQ